MHLTMSIAHPYLPAPLDHGLGGWFGREILGQASTVSWQGQRATDTSLPSILNTFLPGRGIGTFVISWFSNIPSLFGNFQNWINLILTHRSEYLTKQPRFFLVTTSSKLGELVSADWDDGWPQADTGSHQLLTRLPKGAYSTCWHSTHPNAPFLSTVKYANTWFS